MIVKMKKITLLCLESERTRAMEQLRELGIMHVDLTSRVESADVSDLEQQLAEAGKVFNILSPLKKTEKCDKSFSGKEVFKQGSALIENLSELEKKVHVTEHDIDTLAPWGNFQPSLVKTLAADGIHILFCMAYANTYNDFEIPENAVRILIRSVKNERYFLLISTEELDPAAYPVVKLPDASLDELNSQLVQLKKDQNEIAVQMSELACSLAALKEYFNDLKMQYEFATNRDGMSTDGAIAYLSGYVPVPKMELLTEAAHKNGWAVISEDPALDDERVPTCLEHPKWLRIIDPLFDFLGITPGYRENDVAVFFLIAFPIFFGMLVGDFGYGTLFLITAFLCKYLMRKKPEAQMPLNLLILLSCCSMFWGWLNGSCFGLPRNVLPFFLQGPDFFAEPAKSPAACKLAESLNISDPATMSNRLTQWICFLLAGLHLSSARIYKCIMGFRNWRSLGHLGWALLIWANFFTAVELVVFPGTFPKAIGFTLYGVGVFLIVITTTLEAALNLPTSLIGSFVDVLSYIRLFAVGLSGVYVATCFNDMSMMLLNAMPKYLVVFGLIGLILVGIAGHVMNILLSLMGVLVHAVRLNTLEFSNHIDMQWTGIAYRPFKKNK